MESTWETRDLPVLRAIVRITDSDDGPAVSAHDIVRETGFEEGVVQKALRALSHEEPHFFAPGPLRGGMFSLVANVSGHARRTVGSWPTAEGLTERLAAAFAAAADAELEVERKGVLRRGADFFGGVGKDVTAEVIAKVITQGM